MSDLCRAGKRLWSPGDDALMCRLYPDTPTSELARQLRRPVNGIYARANHLGLKKSEAYLASPAACRLRRGDNVGANHRYPKGHAPANKGLRRPGWSPGRMKETQFKPGTRRSDTRAIGDTRLIEGYVYRKVSEVPNVAWLVNWKLEHVLVWTAANGPVPPGHAIVFLNRNRQDVRLENLECISRSELMRRNTVHNLPKPIAQAVQLIGALKRQINRRSREEQNRRPA